LRLVKKQTRVAKHYGVTDRTVRNWLKDGCPQRADGFFDLDQIDLWLTQRGTLPPGLSDAQDAHGDGQDVHGDGKSRAFWEKECKRFMALERELKVKIRKGELLPAAEVAKIAFDVARKTRDAILNIPDRISAIIAAESDEAKVREILRKELTLALAELSTGKKFN